MIRPLIRGRLFCTPPLAIFLDGASQLFPTIEVRAGATCERISLGYNPTKRDYQSRLGIPEKSK